MPQTDHLPKQPAVTPPDIMDRVRSAPRIVVFLVLWSALSLLLFSYRYLEEVADDGQAVWQAPLINETTSAFGGLALAFLVALPLMRRFPLTRENSSRRIPLYVAGLIVFSVIHTTLNWGLRSLFYPLAGLGSFHYGRMPVRYFMEFPADAVSMTIVVVVVHLAWAYRASRDRELRAEQLERALTESRLQSLQLQMQPHFLFNALNTIASRMYDDAPAADKMLTHLASLLRASLTTRDTHLVPLSSELEILDHYVAILRERFGENCAILVDVPDDCRGLAVPALLLQPLVENAVRHGNVSRHGKGRIDVRAIRSNGSLQLDVSDDGPGATGDLWGSGVGLQATADRLAILFPGEHRIEAGNHDGGFHVRMTFPVREATDS
jgi:signal transduction histidine kinase